MNTLDITTKSEVELKALAFECIQIMQTQQNNLKTIEQELQKRYEKTTEVVGETKE